MNAVVLIITYKLHQQMEFVQLSWNCRCRNFLSFPIYIFIVIIFDVFDLEGGQRTQHKRSSAAFTQIEETDKQTEAERDMTACKLGREKRKQEDLLWGR